MDEFFQRGTPEWRAKIRGTNVGGGCLDFLLDIPKPPRPGPLRSDLEIISTCERYLSRWGRIRRRIARWFDPSYDQQMELYNNLCEQMFSAMDRHQDYVDGMQAFLRSPGSIDRAIKDGDIATPVRLRV